MSIHKREKIVRDRDLVEQARRAMARAYAPYSRFRVGAAVLAADGRVFTGCNVENASYGLSICAERSAVAKAVSEGMKEFEAVAICADSPAPVPPCGACRQVLSEFNPRMRVIMAGRSGKTAVARLDRLLPASFGAGQLRKRDR